MSALHQSRDGLRLIVGKQRVGDDPSPGDIREAVLGMSGRDGGVLSLQRGPKHYMRCAGGVESGFALEYQHGGDRAFMSAGDSISAMTTIDLLVSFMTDDERWLTMTLWQPATELLTQPRIKQRKKKRAPIIERHGNTIVINKQFFLFWSGLVWSLLGVLIFFLQDGSDPYGGDGPGFMIAMGLCAMIISGWVDDGINV